jgi:hypothetical protein
MAIDYDAWLQEPYERACREQEAWERAEELLDEGTYAESLSEWLEENVGKTEDDFRESDTYIDLVQNIVDGWNARDDY